LSATDNVENQILLTCSK